MMGDVVIRAENLSKLYRLGERERYRALRDVLTDSLYSPIRRLFGSDGASSKKEEPPTIWALRDVSFEVKRGEVVGIIGRNGAGKSTLLKILSRITRPTSGHVELTGRVGSLLEVGTGFHPELTGRENIYLNGAVLGMRKAEIRKKFDEIVAFAEVEKFLDTPVKRYSSGMYVRLAFAVAAHLEPEILLVDEVLAVGDAAFQKKCLGKMGEVAKEGRTVLFVSHNVTAILALCPRVLLINTGQITKDGDSKYVVQSYTDEYQSISLKTPLNERLDRQGSGFIQAINVRIGTSNNISSGFWICGEDAFITITYKCYHEKMCRNIEIAFGIKTYNQTPLLYLGTKVVHQDIDIVKCLGYSICKINRLPIEPGKYSLDTEIKLNGVIADHVQCASFINVIEGDYYGTGVIWPYSGFLCDYSWSHYSGDRDVTSW